MRATIAIDLRIASPRNLEKQTSHWWLVVSTHEGQFAASSKGMGNLPIYPRAGRGLSISNVSNSSPGGRTRVGPSTVLTGRCTCEDTIRLGSRKPSQPSFVARLIQQRLMTARGANGPVCHGAPRNTRTWASRCGISSSAKAVSTNARPGLLVAGLRRSHACAIKTHRLFMLSF